MSIAPSEADDLVALSGLQHVVFCERQAALIHVERVWRENVATTEGNLLHTRVDLPGADNRRGVRVHRAVALRSDRLGIAGVADAVEYHADASDPGGVRPFPIEYKRGRAQQRLADQVQLCAQALCLEEMHGVSVPRGALYYGQSHRRVDVAFDEALRARTEEAARRLHALIRARVVPRAALAPKCKSCSLAPVCMPEITGGGERASAYLARLTRPAEVE